MTLLLLRLALPLLFFGGGGPAINTFIDLKADFAQDNLEATEGVFIQPNIAGVTGGNFDSLKYLMRPVRLATVSTDPAMLSVLGDPILEVYTQTGTPVTLPQMFLPSDLPVTLLVNATDTGNATLRFALQVGGLGIKHDDILFRSGIFPGLAGKDLSEYPFFQFTTAIQENSVVQTAVDPTRHGARVGLPFDVYVVEHKTSAEWGLDNSLVDVSGGAEASSVMAGGIDDNVVDAWTSGIDADAGTGFGVPYDVVYDFGLDGTLDPGDLIDGFTSSSGFAGTVGPFDPNEAGFYAVHDITTLGPLPTTPITYSGGTFLGQRTVYPTDIASMGQLPLVVISHGNGHQYTWYDYLQRHLSSYGYIVMSHQNNTGPGIETASTTTLTNTEYILANQSTIGGGVMDGHIDSSRITWIGHSRGGEGVCRAYDRIFDGTYSPVNFSIGDIAVISSIAPTDFLGRFSATPHGANYHFLYGAADGDVCGCPTSDIAQAFHLYERAEGISASTYVQGADHNDFNCCGFNDYDGPPAAEIGRTEAQRVAKAAYLAVVKHFVEGNIPAKDYLWRQYEDLKPISVAGTTVVDNLYEEEGPSAQVFVIDSYQSQTSTVISSSGGSVSFNVSNIFENVLNDNNTSFTWTTSDRMNGMTVAGSGDVSRGVVFDYNSPTFMEWEVIAGERDLSDDQYLSFRACQGTRHPRTTAVLGDLTFTVTLRDGSGTTSSINIGAYGGGIEEPFQRTGFGTGVGWQNEFETIRMRLTDFQANGSGLDITDVVAVRFEFGTGFGDAQGRLGVDDLEIVKVL